MQASLTEQNVIKASAQFWEQMLAMHLDPMHGDAAICLDERHVSGSIELSGVWAGRVEIRMDQQLAQFATAAMMMQPVETVGDADTLDATKEIANMIAGVIKSSLPRPCNMALPEAAFEPIRYCPGEDASNMIVVTFRHESGDMLVRVTETMAAAGQAEELQARQALAASGA